MTEFDQAYIRRGTLRKEQEAEEQYPGTDWKWYMVGAIVAVVSLAYMASYIVSGLFA
jgi:cytochrome c-type biogenesis protein CcmH/NrfG